MSVVNSVSAASSRTMISDNGGMESSLMPSFFLSHGGGPMFLLSDKEGRFSEIDSNSPTADFYRSFATKCLPCRPSSILVISAHWETDENSPLQVTSAEHPELLYDYFGFPEEAYAPHLLYSPPGSPELAERVQALLGKTLATGVSSKTKNKTISVTLNSRRGLDHGVFIPLKLMFPEADIPVVQLSLSRSLDPSFHLHVGAALAPLRREGILILGSGQMTHSFSQMLSPGEPLVPWALEFKNWVLQTLGITNGNSNGWARQLLQWKRAPSALRAHPREEHWIPLLVAAAASDPHSAVNAIRENAAPSKKSKNSKILPSGFSNESPENTFHANVIHDGYAMGSMLMTSLRFD